MLLPTPLPHRPLGAFRGHAAHGNRSLFSQASGHLTVLQPVCSSGTSANQLVIDLWAFSALHSSPSCLSALFFSKSLLLMFSGVTEHCKGLTIQLNSGVFQ